MIEVKQAQKSDCYTKADPLLASEDRVPMWQTEKTYPAANKPSGCTDTLSVSP